MKRFSSLLLLASFALLASCKGNDGATNEYRNAKHHPSEQIAAEHKKAGKKAQKDFKKQLKRNKKHLNNG